MESSRKRNFTWIYIFTGILAVLGIMGLLRGDWVSGGYVLGAMGLGMWIYGTRQRKNGAGRIGLVLAGAGLAILLFDLIRRFAA